MLPRSRFAVRLREKKREGGKCSQCHSYGINMRRLRLGVARPRISIHRRTSCGGERAELFQTRGEKRLYQTKFCQNYRLFLSLSRRRVVFPFNSQILLKGLKAKWYCDSSQLRHRSRLHYRDHRIPKIDIFIFYNITCIKKSSFYTQKRFTCISFFLRKKSKWFFIHVTNRVFAMKKLAITTWQVESFEDCPRYRKRLIAQHPFLQWKPRIWICGYRLDASSVCREFRDMYSFMIPASGKIRRLDRASRESSLSLFFFLFPSRSSFFNHARRSIH